MNLIYRFLSSARRLYWYIFRPKTVGVKCLIEYNGAYLFIKHAYGSRQNNWNLPGGGVRLGENPEDAVRREVKEELSIELVNIKKLGHYISDADYNRDTVHCYHAIISSSALILKKNEIASAEWFLKTGLPQNISRSIKESFSFLRNSS